MNCRRCHGLMCAVDFLVSARNYEDDGLCGWRCIICGEIIDPVIAWNRIRTKNQRQIQNKQKSAHRLYRTVPSSLSLHGGRSER